MKRNLRIVLSAAILAFAGNAAFLKARDSKNATTVSNGQCALPANARWCDVRAGAASFTMAVYASNDIVSNSICSTGTWEVSSVADLGPPGTALDIGANVGYYAFLMASVGWHVKAFEPLPSNVALIRASLCRNPSFASRVSLFPIGLGPKDDHCLFISGHDNIGDGWAKCGSTVAPPGYAIRGEFDVHRLDDVMSQHGLQHVDFVKLDVEGFECQVFKGASQMLTTYRPKSIQTEVWPHMQGCQPHDYLQMFADNGYIVAKTRNCFSPSTALSGNVEDFFACRRGTRNSTLLQQVPKGRKQQVILRLA